MSSASSVVRARITPNSAITASVTRSSPAIDAVCDRAASRPIDDVPTFIMITGLRTRRAAANAARKLSGSRMPSEYATITSVCSSSASQPITSPIVTSASLPVVTQIGVPRPRLRATANTCVP